MKRIYDPIHGFIELEKWEYELTKTTPFRRLMSIHQIGSAFFVYNGGHHKRSEHSIGTMYVSTLIYNRVTKKQDLVEIADLPKKGSKEHHYWRKVLRAASLCHDLGHPPFSHMAEDILLHGKRHEEWTLKFIYSNDLKRVWDIAGLDPDHVAKVAVGDKYYDGSYTDWEKIVTEMLTGDFFGSDRIDYLLRDSYFTGLAYGEFDHQQLIESLRILPFQGSYKLGVEENGLESCYALLFARYFMHRRLYQYSNVKSYSFHFARYLKHYFQDIDITTSLDTYLRTNDYAVLADIFHALNDKEHERHEEAKRLMNQEERYLAYSLDKEEFENLVQGAAFADEEVIFDHRKNTGSSGELSFPVLQKNAIITEAETIAEVSIPMNFKKWVYVSPKIEAAFLKHKDHASTNDQQSQKRDKDLL